VKTYKTICISLYVEELIALDAKVEALKAAGYRKANRSAVLAIAAVHIDDAELVALMPKSREAVPKQPKPVKEQKPRRAWDGNRCGKCGVAGHYARTCRGVDVESDRVPCRFVVPRAEEGSASVSYIVRAFWWLFGALFGARVSYAYIALVLVLVSTRSEWIGWWVTLIVGSVACGALRSIAKRRES
jgi:hypothetical protein